MSETVFASRRAVVTRAGRCLVDRVDLEIRSGELVVLLGPNGAGKTSLLRILAGELSPDGGGAEFAGRPISAWKPRELARRRAVLPQDSQVAFPFAALEVVLLGRSPHDGGYPGARDFALAREALERVDAGHLESRLYPTLSGGERSRVMLARVLAQLAERIAPCRGLLLDEPVAALDVAHQHLVLRVARELAHRDGVAVVAVLHDLNLASRYADRVCLLRDGRVLAQGMTEEVLEEKLLGRCFDVPISRIDHPGCIHPLLVATEAV